MHLGSRWRVWFCAWLVFTLTLLETGSAVAAGPKAGEHWVGTWSASPEAAAGGIGSNDGFDNQTLRMIVHTSVGGRRVRVRLSNGYGATALVIGAAHIALRREGAAIRPDSDHPLTFSGQKSVTIPPGAFVLSDPVDFDVPPLGDLSVSVYVPDKTGPATWHATGHHETYISASGDFTGTTDVPYTITKPSWYWLSGVDVLAPAGVQAVVAFGDSITDGATAKPDTNSDWPSELARKLLAKSGRHPMAVLNEGISGNRILHDFIGQNALARFDADVLAQPGVRCVIVLEGINDIGFSAAKIPGRDTASEAVTADEIIGGLRQIVERAHEHGIAIFGGTLTPFEGARYYSAEGEAKRQAVNAWIRTGGAFDGVIDFDAAVRDPAHPTQVLTSNDSGDHLHPSAAGYQAMGDAVDLSLFSMAASK
ncbi:MAG: SGNH/GDSL hydrolase family protein [Candidatus Acidiferrales bacterium]|jgi:lysophospholipase L1-like esterase